MTKEEIIEIWILINVGDFIWEVHGGLLLIIQKEELSLTHLTNSECMLGQVYRFAWFCQLEFFSGYFFTDVKLSHEWVKLWKYTEPNPIDVDRVHVSWSILGVFLECLCFWVQFVKQFKDLGFGVVSAHHYIFRLELEHISE